MEKLFLFLAIFLSYPALSQTDSSQRQNNILTCTKLRRGIYKSFHEFKTNSPSVTREFEVVRASKSKRVLMGTAEIKPMYIDPAGKLSKVEKKMWGFCDGDTIYLAIEKDVYSNEYVKLFHLGRYSLFSSYSSLSSLSRGIIGGALGSILSKSVGAINYEDGEIMDLDADTTLELLAPNSQLRDQYLKEAKKDKEDKMVEYMTTYNQWYLEKATK